MTFDGTSTFAVVQSPPAEPPLVGLIATLGPPGSAYLDPPDDFAAFALPPLVRPGTVAPPPTAPLVPAGGRAGALPGPQRWEGGFQYLPEQQCYEGRAEDPCAPSGMDIPQNPALVKAMPYLVWAGDHCSAFGWSAHNWVERAERALLATESKQIAHELWNGTQAKASGWPNAYLASPSAQLISSTALAPADALDVLEQGLADCSNGARGAIHCTRQLGSFLSGLGGTLRTVGGQIMTYAGTLIIPDAGYDGSSPSGVAASAGHQWAYGTLMPTVRRSPVEVLPGSFSEAFDRLHNTVEFRAERLAAATFPPCCLVAVEVNLPLPVGGIS